MANTFRSDLDKANDVKSRLQALTSGTPPVAIFKQVEVYLGQDWKELEDMIDSQVIPPAAVIVPGEGHFPPAAGELRTKRETSFDVFIVGGMPTQQAGDRGGIMPLVERVITAFMPDDATPGKPLTLNYVVWQPDGVAVIPAGPNGAVRAVRLQAIDFYRTH